MKDRKKNLVSRAADSNKGKHTLNNRKL